MSSAAEHSTEAAAAAAPLLSQDAKSHSGVATVCCAECCLYLTNFYVGGSDNKPEENMKKGLKGFGQKVSNLFTKSEKLVLSQQTATETDTPCNVLADAHSATGFPVCA
jgi:hypothetical protein